jgi:hypothetical protein
MTDDVVVFNSKALNKLDKSQLHKHNGVNNIFHWPSNVCGEFCLPVWHKESGPVQKRLFAIIRDQGLIALFNGSQKDGITSAKLSSHGNVLRPLPRKDKAKFKIYFRVGNDRLGESDVR